MRRVLTWLTRAAAALLALLAALWLVSEPAPEYPAWTEPLPSQAVKLGYSRYLRWGGGRAIPGLADAWLERHPPDPMGPVLIDAWHSSKQPASSALRLDSYAYDRMHGYARAFESLERAGVPTRTVRAPFTAAQLGGASAVFINLVSGDNPGFWWSEVLALESFVRRGGGLFLITDHTNCYFHAEQLQPLTAAFGLELPPVTAADQGVGNTLSPTTVAWLRVRPVAEHPVTAGVGAFGFMTGGAVRVRPGVQGTVLAATSPSGWFDQWAPYLKEDSSGFTGDLKRAPEEAPGPVPVMLAVGHGAGRVVVFADQNAFGATLVGYEDTERLFANTMAWVSGRAVTAEPRAPRSVTTLTGERSLCTSAAPYAFRTLQVQLSRMTAWTGIPEYCTVAAETRSERLLVLPDATHPRLAALIGEARRGVLLLDRDGAGVLAALAELGLSVDVSAEPAPAEGLIWAESLPAPPHPVMAKRPTTEPLRVAPLAVQGEGLRVLAADSTGRPVVVEWSRGQARHLLVLDADLLRNEGMGKERDLPRGSPERAAAHRLAFELLGWLWAP